MSKEFCIMPPNPIYKTERFYGSHRHEVFFGTANRKQSIEDGLVVFLKPELHTGSKGVHNNREIDLYLKIIGQRAWMEYYNKSENDFIKRYGKSYI